MAGHWRVLLVLHTHFPAENRRETQLNILEGQSGEERKREGKIFFYFGGEKKGGLKGGRGAIRPRGGGDSLSLVRACRAILPGPRRSAVLRAPLVPRDTST